MAMSNATKNAYLDDIKKACDVMRNGGIILYPTDTVWGIGCDATNKEAVAKVYKLKQRCDSKALIILLDNEKLLQRYVDEVPDVAYELINVTIKPLTIIYDNGINLCKELLAEDNSIGIRITHEEFSRQLCQSLRKPIVSTSANVSGQPTPNCFNEISQEIKQGVDYIVQYNQHDTEPRQASSVIKLRNDGVIKILRN